MSGLNTVRNLILRLQRFRRFDPPTTPRTIRQLNGLVALRLVNMPTINLIPRFLLFPQSVVFGVWQ